MTNYIELPAQEINHPGGNFYVFICNSDILQRIAYVSIEERNSKGVQRPLSERRCKEVAKFINSNDAIIANNIILNLPEETEYIAPTENELIGKIKFPDIEKSVWVVDGQHRLFGFNFTAKKLDLLCSGFINLKLESQAKIFITINNEQKGINPSVIYDLLPLIKDSDFKEKRTHSLVKQMNLDPESPWYNEIKMLGIGKGLVSQAAFARNVEVMIDPNGGVLSPYNENLQYGILVNYFNAFKAVFSEEWGSTKYVLTKAVVLSAMCGIFPKVHSLCGKDFTVENIIKQIIHLKKFDFSSAKLGKSTNKVAIQKITADLNKMLPEISDTSDIKI
ncbi:hypothetical protein NIES37_41170 [Tolypothrix tenuis PCC 7101]|uniref:DGQHR domain protein n=1 Tax=Tolypothrix tenuis PCC 7101 TaxID=231146 RepID=A0A1Z4N326_9CYAN|nr:DGQHR domain-containing protein [Aulosira sp. FACHB-113]BAZ00134.1 hypothetical protein NIES37_41170 [Tolypothrix tenuis PCC 7101]BAZ75945.1 hypothetical protein NIES50_45420 [Aulosira laxa NIES-50]